MITGTRGTTNHGGLGRLAYIGVQIGFFAFISVSAALLIPSIKTTEEELATPAFLVFGAFALILWITTLLRLTNIGYSKWWSLILLVPGLNAMLVALCWCLPPGYAETKRLDLAGKIGVLVILALFVIGFIKGYLDTTQVITNAEQNVLEQEYTQ